ncbi:MAG TPA: hypothetical protein VHL60_10645 [Oxalicibacterium sp.]|jgi:hypothetical protein|nr:hypothetical protein [Oxalicibacterium sp.]
MNYRYPFAALLLSTMLPYAAHADTQDKHPAYLHALSDLRDARANLEHKAGNDRVSQQEDKAIAEIDYAAQAVKRIAAADDKGLYNRPHEDAQFDHAGRLHHAEDLLQKAKSDLAQREDNEEAKKLQRHAIDHVQAALQATEMAIKEVEHGAH